MKAIDTNILVRFLINDDPAQADRVYRLFEETERSGERIFISLPVIMETIWVLMTRYECPTSLIYEMLERLILVPYLEFESAGRIQLLTTLGPGSKLDPADLMIALTARDRGCEATLTFDRKAARSEFFELLR